MALQVTTTRSRMIGAASALAIGFAAAPALAQDRPADENAPREAEIVVTAQKRSERLQDVPISITVVNPELLESTNARNFA